MGGSVGRIGGKAAFKSLKITAFSLEEACELVEYIAYPKALRDSPLRPLDRVQSEQAIHNHSPHYLNKSHSKFMIIGHDRDAQILVGDTHDLATLAGEHTTVLDDVDAAVGVQLLSESGRARAGEVFIREV